MKTTAKNIENDTFFITKAPTGRAMSAIAQAIDGIIAEEKRRLGPKTPLWVVHASITRALGTALAGICLQTDDPRGIFRESVKLIANEGTDMLKWALSGGGAAAAHAVYAAVHEDDPPLSDDEFEIVTRVRVKDAPALYEAAKAAVVGKVSKALEKGHPAEWMTEADFEKERMDEGEDGMGADPVASDLTDAMDIEAMLPPGVEWIGSVCGRAQERRE